jgi:hypothetical protein
LHVWIDGRRERGDTDVASILDNLKFSVIPQQLEAMLKKMTAAERAHFDSESLNFLLLNGGKFSGIMDALMAILGSDFTRLQAEVIAKTNAQKNDFRASFNAIAWSMQFEVIAEFEESSKEETALIREAKKEAKAAHIDAVAAAKDLTHSEFERLTSKKHKPRPAEVLEIEKFKLKEEYRQDVDVDLVKWDKRGKGRRILRRVERLLNPGAAVNEDADELISILKKEKSPFSVNNNVVFIDVYSYMLAVAGYSIVDGKVVHNGLELTNDDLKEFHSSMIERRRILNLFHSTDSLFKKGKPMQILQLFLEDIGLELTAKRRKENGEIYRFYSASVKKLAKLNGFIERRRLDDNLTLQLG